LSRSSAATQAGEIHDLPRVEAEVAISTGFAQVVAVETSASAPSNEEAKGEVASETPAAPAAIETPAAAPATEAPAAETTTAPAATDVAQA
jgi:hypothetical protein